MILDGKLDTNCIQITIVGEWQLQIIKKYYTFL